jgi:cell division protein FtsI/penicillin-binding protein 2
MEQPQGLYYREKRRMFIALLMMIALLIGIVCKLLWIQVFSSRSYSYRDIDLVRGSVLQRQKALVLDSGRGQFFDRNMTPMTGERIKALVAFPVRGEFQATKGQAAELAAILHTSVGVWHSFADQLSEPRIWAGNGEPASALSTDQVKRIEQLQLPNLKVVDYTKRYPETSIAAQLLGFIGQNPERIQAMYASQLANGKMSLASEIGGAGLEKTFEPWLRGIGETSISYFTDAGKRPLDGLDARLVAPNNAYYPLKVETTIDYNLQKSIESLMAKLNIHEGAAVVLNADHADVLAMASRPEFHPSDIHLDTANWSNHALKAVAPGSIFKTVVAAAALEEGVVQPGETFDCKGALGKYGFTCWKKEGHGHLTLEEGFAESCNIVFAEVMKRLSAKQLEDYAKRMGLVAQVGWTGSSDWNKQLKQLDSEEAGQLFAPQTPREDEGVRLQTAIGQRDVLVSPLQAANLVVTLLHNGVVYSPRVVKEVRFQTDQVMERFDARKLANTGNPISAKTSRQLVAWMKEFVQSGTGKGLQGALWELAGKSGTAQLQTGKEEKVNQWFIGYGPANAPKYAVSVVVENAGAFETNKAIPLFRGIMDLLAERQG